jgi:DDE superfamily endonuclease
LLVTDGAGSWCVEDAGPSRRCRRSPGDWVVPGGPGGAGRRTETALAVAPGRTPGRSAAAAGGRSRCPAPAGVHRPAAGHLVHLRHGVTHDVLACWFGVSRSTIMRVVGEVRWLLAEPAGRPAASGAPAHRPDHSPTRATAPGATGDYCAPAASAAPFRRRPTKPLTADAGARPAACIRPGTGQPESPRVAGDGLVTPA